MLLTTTKSFGVMPKGLYTLTLAELVDRFSFYGCLSILILYLRIDLAVPSASVFSFWGTFIALGFILPTVGGYLADRFLGNKTAIIAGGLLIAIANFILAVHRVSCLYLGLSVLLCGIGLFKGNISSLVGKLYEPNTADLDKGYTFFFAGMSAGSILGPIAYGLCITTLGLSCGFIISGGLMLLSVGLFSWSFHTHCGRLDTHLWTSWKELLTKYFVLIIGICVLTGVALVLLLHPRIGNPLLGGFSVVTLALLFIVAALSAKAYRKNICILAAINIAVVFYVASSLQVNGAVLLYINQSIKHVIFDWQIPVPFFASLESIFSVLATPFLLIFWKYLARHQREPSIPNKMIVGMLLTAACFWILSKTQLDFINPLLLIVLANILLGIGAVMITPPQMSAISLLAPEKLASTIMGMSFMSDGLAGYVGSLIAEAGVLLDIKSSASLYLKSFEFIVILMIVVAIALIPLNRFFARHLKN